VGRRQFHRAGSKCAGSHGLNRRDLNALTKPGWEPRLDDAVINSGLVQLSGCLIRDFATMSDEHDAQALAHEMSDDCHGNESLPGTGWRYEQNPTFDGV